MERSNTFLVVALAGFILALAAGNVIGWAALFLALPLAAIIISVVALSSEVICANIAMEMAANVKAKAWPKVWGNIFIATVLVTMNTVGSHNAWEVAENALLQDRRAEATQRVERDLRAAQSIVDRIDNQIDAIPVPDPTLGPLNYRARLDFYQARVAVLLPRKKDAAGALAALPKAAGTINLIPPIATFPLFGVLEMVKFVGFWSLASIGFSWPMLMFWRTPPAPASAPLTATEHASALAKRRAEKARLKASAQTTE